MTSANDKTCSYSFFRIGKNGIKKSVVLACVTDSEGGPVYWLNSEDSSLSEIKAVLKKYNGMKFRTSTEFRYLNEDEIKKALG